ncbi:alpha/beta fold hydrolase [Amorphus coralli]|uniref:alpha/beta fold hydrolase n=1 Tax=Amorphus coralli TaxID=340680 RepID=UPI00036E5335|nr:alpha/beta hydrolase [Amorphus coralli]
MTGGPETGEWTELTWTGADGTPLFARHYAPAKATTLPPVVCLPGLTRNSRDFTLLARYLSRKAEKPRAVIAMDFRGRGRSGYADWQTYTPQTELDDTLRGLDAAGISTAAFVGTSRGGLVMMAIALVAPERMTAAVLNDIGPRIERNGLARIAGYVGDESPDTWEAAVDALRQGQEEIFPDLVAEEWVRFAHQVFRDDNGKPVYDYDPALQDAFEAFNPETPLPDLWPAYYAMKATPVMVVRGGLSDILSTATLEAMRQAHPKMTTLVIPDQGHAPLLWDVPTHQRIAEFLSAADERRWPPRACD